MRIKLISHPHGAPGCVLLKLCDKRRADEDNTKLIQSDYDFPGIASTFGFSLATVQAPGHGGSLTTTRPACHHQGTDGTVKCEDCGLAAGDFINAARTFLDEHDGARAEDPGYF